MRRALELARAAGDSGEVPIGAVVYRALTPDLPQIVSEGANRREIDNDPLAHAEILAIRAAAKAQGDWRLSDLRIAVTLEPCPMCAGAIVNARLCRLVFAAHDPKAGACRSLMRLTEDPRLNHRVTPIAGILADEASQLLRDFFRSLRQEKKPAP
ncbi:MAG: nucleoside deaminase [Phycisphaerales bacterium]|nr:nucleoside deaminase [Phycisphaerales bacterium]